MANRYGYFYDFRHGVCYELFRCIGSLGTIAPFDRKFKDKTHHQWMMWNRLQLARL